MLNVLSAFPLANTRETIQIGTLQQQQQQPRQIDPFIYPTCVSGSSSPHCAVSPHCAAHDRPWRWQISALAIFPTSPAAAHPLWRRGLLRGGSSLHYTYIHTYTCVCTCAYHDRCHLHLQSSEVTPSRAHFVRMLVDRYRPR